MPSGKSGLPRSSCAIGENSTTRGADLPLYFCASVCAIQSAQLLLECLEPGLASKRLVVTKEGKHDVRLGFSAGKAVVLVAADWGAETAQPLVGCSKVLRARARTDFVAAEAKVTNDELVLGKASLQHRLEPAVVLQSLGERIADDADVVMGLKRESLTGLYSAHAVVRLTRPTER